MKSFKSGFRTKIVSLTATLALMASLAACGPGNSNTTTTATSAASTTEASKLSGEIIIDGSSTVFPITEAVAEEFIALNPNVRIPVGVSGTGGGMKKFVVGETDICDASRAIKDSEKETAKTNGIEFVEFKVAYDGITVTVNPKNTWVTSLTVANLKKMWQIDSTVKTWKDINPEWPADEINFYSPGTDSGTFEFFTEKINGKAGDIRKDITPSEDDNVLVQGIAGDKNAIGFFGYSYYAENKDKLKEISIDAGNGPVMPTEATIKDLSYKPLARPLFIYVNKKSLEKEHVKAFVEYYLTEGTALISEVMYVPLESYTEELAKLK